MKTKKLTLILISVVFLIVILLVCSSMFSLKKTDVVYAVSEKNDSEAIQSVIDGYIGKNLLFLDTEEIKTELSKFAYIEVVSIEKDYPNVLKVKLKERREIYYLESADKVYVLTDDGFVLNSFDKSNFVYENLRDKIMLKFSGINTIEVSVGNMLKTDNDELVKSVFEMAKSVELTDCIREISIVSAPEIKWGVFSTYTGVDMQIIDADNDGLIKISKAFEVYEAEANDFEKTFNVIEVNKDATGDIVAIWKSVITGPGIQPEEGAESGVEGNS